MRLSTVTQHRCGPTRNTYQYKEDGPMGSAKARSVLLVALLITFLSLLAGCVALTIPGLEPPAEAVLAGTWALIQNADQALSETFWVFDDNGNLVEMRTKMGPVEITRQAGPASTSVEDSHVIIQLGTDLGNMSFDGTFNEDQSRIEGSLSTQMSWLGTTIRIDGGSATLVKQ
jgi:hypothetical protein